MNSKLFVSDTIHELNCLVYYPDNYKDLPMILFLHGAGERGKKSDHLTRHGIPKLISEGKEIPAIVVCPQCPQTFIWNNVVEEVKDIVLQVAEMFDIKRDRIMVTGSSMGGYGTWEIAMCYPEIFAAAAPVAGGGVTFRTCKLHNIPIKAYHGNKDDAVEFINSELMVNAVNRFGGSAELVILDNMGHNDAIDFAYRSTDLISWLISNRKTDFTRIPEPCECCF